MKLPPDIRWNPENLDSRPVFQLGSDKFLRLDSVPEGFRTRLAPGFFCLYIEYSLRVSEPSNAHAYAWPDWIAKAKAWNEWALGRELRLQATS